MKLKTLSMIDSQRKERFQVPKSVQDIMPVSFVWEDGIFQVGKTQFSASYCFTDINYLIAGASERRAMYDAYQDLLDALGPGAVYKITTNNRHVNMALWQKDNMIQHKGDVRDHYIDEYNEMLKEKVIEADGITQELYLTITAFKNTIDEARGYFNRIWSVLYGNFSRLGSHLHRMDAVERLRVFHSFFRPGEEETFHVNYWETLRRGHDFRDAFCPSGITKMDDHLKIGDKYVRSLFCIDYASYVRDDLISRLTQLPQSMMVSVDVISMPKDESAALLQNKRDGVEMNVTKWQQRQNSSNNFAAEIPYHMKVQREQMDEIMDDVIKNDQGLHIVTLTVVHAADSIEQLNADTERLKAIMDCTLMVATFQQLEGLITALPFGVNKLSAKRTLLTRCLAAVSIPFRVQEIQEKGGVFYGVNMLTHNLILCNRDNLQNQGAFILGVPGFGKSMIAKEQIAFIILSSEDTVFILDPEGEYTAMVRALQGEVIKIKAGDTDYINALDMCTGYGLKGGIADKSDYVQELFQQMSESPLSAQAKTIIDRCVLELYSRGVTVTLMDLRELLLKQPEPESKALALTLERFTTGSLDAFAHETNVDLSNRLVSFDLSGLKPQLRKIAQLTITDFLTNQVNLGWQAGRKTHIFTDEIQTFFTNEHTAQFFDSAWRQWRKRGAFPTAITQNVSVLLENEQAKAMLSNSEIVILLNQAAADQQQLSQVFRLPDEQLHFVRNAEFGCGLLLYGGKTVPFINRFPVNTNLYKLMTTKPDEGFNGELHD